MPVVVSLIWMWLSIHAFAALPRKLPLRLNVLLYMSFSVFDINKLTLLAFKFKLFTYAPKVPDFLPIVIYRDFAFSLMILAFANACLTAKRRADRWIAAIAAFLFLLLAGQSLRWTGVLQNHHWNLFFEGLMVAAMMGLAYGLAAGLLKIWERESGEIDK